MFQLRIKSSAVILCATFFCLATTTSSAEENNIALAEENSHSEISWEFDAYYSDVGVNIPLTEKPIPTIRSNKELVILERLIEDSFMPRFMLLEASIYPMPILGTYLKSNQPHLYQTGQIGQSNLNIIESATAGFQEP